MMAAVVKACARRPQNGRTNCAPRIDVRAEVAGTAPSAETVRPARSRPGAVLGPSKETARRLLREAQWTPGGGQALRRRAARCPRRSRSTSPAISLQYLLMELAEARLGLLFRLSQESLNAFCALFLMVIKSAI